MIRFTLIRDASTSTDFAEVLRGWHTLQQPLRQTESITWCVLAYQHELHNANRKQILKRIQSRMVGILSTNGSKWVRRLCNELSENKNNT